MKTKLGAALVGVGVLVTALGMTGLSHALVAGGPLPDFLVAMTTGGWILLVISLVSRFEQHAQIQAQQMETYSHWRRAHLRKVNTTLSGATTA